MSVCPSVCLYATFISRSRRGTDTRPGSFNSPKSVGIPVKISLSKNGSGCTHRESNPGRVGERNTRYPLRQGRGSHPGHPLPIYWDPDTSRWFEGYQNWSQYCFAELRDRSQYCYRGLKGEAEEKGRASSSSRGQIVR